MSNTKLLGLALLPLFVGAPGRTNDSGDAARPGEMVVRRGDFEERFVLTGNLKAVRSRPLTTPRTDNWMVSIRWLAPEGAMVKAGETVVQFDTSTITSGLNDKRLGAIEAANTLDRTTLQLEAQRRDKRIEALRRRVERDKAKLDAEVPATLQAQRDYQEKQLALTRAESALKKGDAELKSFEEDAASQLEVLRLRLEKAKRDVERAEISLDALILEAPVDGVIVYGTHPWERRKWQVGDSSWAGTTIAEVPDLSLMEVETLLHDVDDGALAPATTVRCVLDTYPDKSYAGHVRRISGAAQELDRKSSRRFFTVAIELDEVDAELMRPGMSVKVEAVRRRLENALLVPRAAVDFSGERPKLLLKGKAPVEVEVAGCEALTCALESGPEVGTLLEARP